MSKRPRRTSFAVELGRVLAQQHVSYRELSRRTGLAPQTLHRYAMGVRRPADETIEAIAEALELDPADFREWRRRRVLEKVGESEQLVDALYRRIA